MVERSLSMREVSGSIPDASKILNNFHFLSLLSSCTVLQETMQNVSRSGNHYEKLFNSYKLKVEKSMVSSISISIIICIT